MNYNFNSMDPNSYGFNFYTYYDRAKRINKKIITMKNYKATLYGAVTYSVIIGAIYVALSILALLTRWCVIEATGSGLAYMLYWIYFRVGSCKAEIDWSILGVESTLSLEVPEETEAVRRTFIFVITYLGLHGALIVTSLYALCGVNNSCLGRRSFPIFFVPWLVVLMAIVVLDVLATVYYIIDSVSLLSLDGFIEILEIKNAADAITAFGGMALHYRYLPPIIMLITTAKIFLLFITNIIWIIFITKAGWTASTYHKYLDQTRRNYENTMSSVNPAFESIRDDAVAQKQSERQMEYLSDQSSIHDVPSSTLKHAKPSAPPSDETRYNDTARLQGYAYPYQTSTARNEKHQAPQPPKQVIEEDQLAYKIKRPTTLVIPERPLSQHQHNNQNNVDREIDNRLSRYQESSGNVIKTNEPLKYDDISEQQQSNTRVFVLPPITEGSRPNSEHRNKPIPPPKPQNNRFSIQPSGRESPVLYRPERSHSAKVDRTSSSLRAPEELRSQLPWSYFKPRDEAPKKAFNHLEENEDIPAVPIPDYTLHYGKKGRSNLSDSDGDGTWNHQRY